MPSVLIAWEFGSGLGHVAPLRAIGAELIQRGDEVTIVTSNVELCRQAFAGWGVETLATPALPLSAKRLKFPCTYSDILHDAGYSSAENVVTAVAEWLKIFDSIEPHLLIADHSPSALVASRARNFPTAIASNGYLCPPDITPLPSLRTEIPAPHWAAEVEQTVLDSMNAAIAAHDGKPVSHVAQLFADANRQYLLTFPQLDHYRPWRNEDSPFRTYWPTVGALPGQLVDWPDRPTLNPDCPRVFVYLHKSPVVYPVLKGMAYKRIPTICFAPRMRAAERAEFAGTSVFVATTPVDLRPLAQQCDAAVINGGNGTVCELIRAGVPMILLPLTLEQQLTGDRIERLGIGLHAPLSDLDAIASALERLLEDQTIKETARSFAQQFSTVIEEEQVARLVDDIQSLQNSS